MTNDRRRGLVRWQLDWYNLDELNDSLKRLFPLLSDNKVKMCFINTV